MNQVRFCVHPSLEEKDRQKVCKGCGKKFGSDFKLHATEQAQPFFRPGAIIEFQGRVPPPMPTITTWITNPMGHKVE